VSLILDGTNGLSDVDGSASTPAIRGTDTNTGIFFPAADTIAFAEGGAEVARFDSSGNLGIGTTTPARKLSVVDSSAPHIQLAISSDQASGNGFELAFDGSANYIAGRENVPMLFSTNNTERMRIDSAGQVFVKPSTGGSGPSNGDAGFYSDGGFGNALVLGNTYGAGKEFARFTTNSTQVGSIVANGTTNTSYNTSSDYRLKENIAPMTGALAVIGQLKPCTYTWKADGSDGQGFIAHELQEVVPDCVTGEKDAVDAEGNIKPQAIDTSFLVATLTAAIQELKAELDGVKAELATLKA
jgi:hypothetical protein